MTPEDRMISEAENRGKLLGKFEKGIEDAARMLAEGIPLDVVMKITRLNSEDIISSYHSD